MRFLITTCLLLFAACAAVTAGSGDEFLGIWKTDKGDSIEIYKDGSTYSARISDLVEKVYEDGDDMAGKPKVDRENPDKSKRDTPIMGLVFMEGFTYKSGVWSGGTIYDPENGKTYKCKITMPDDKKLKVRGFIGVSLIGRTAVWTR